MSEVPRFSEGQVVRDKTTGRVGVVYKVANPPWDIYISVRFPDGTTGYNLASNFEKTRKIPRFTMRGDTLKLKRR